MDVVYVPTSRYLVKRFMHGAGAATAAIPLPVLTGRGKGRRRRDLRFRENFVAAHRAFVGDRATLAERLRIAPHRTSATPSRFRFATTAPAFPKRSWTSCSSPT